MPDYNEGYFVNSFKGLHDKIDLSAHKVLEREVDLIRDLRKLIKQQDEIIEENKTTIEDLQREFANLAEEGRKLNELIRGREPETKTNQLDNIL